MEHHRNGVHNIAAVSSAFDLSPSPYRWPFVWRGKIPQEITPEWQEKKYLEAFSLIDSDPSRRGYGVQLIE